MTEQRAPQDLARDLAKKLHGLWLISSGSGHPGFLEKAAAMIAAHTASQLAGAVPQEELRALIAKWRTKKWEDDHMAQMDVGVLFFPSHACANEFESLIEKRTVKS